MHVPKLFKASAASETDWLRAPHVVSHTCAVHPPVGNTEMRYQLAYGRENAAGPETAFGIPKPREECDSTTIDDLGL